MNTSDSDPTQYRGTPAIIQTNRQQHGSNPCDKASNLQLNGPLCDQNVMLLRILLCFDLWIHTEPC